MPEYAELSRDEFDITAMLVGVLLVVGLCTWYGFVFLTRKNRSGRWRLKPKPASHPISPAYRKVFVYAF